MSLLPQCLNIGGILCIIVYITVFLPGGVILCTYPPAREAGYPACEIPFLAVTWILGHASWILAHGSWNLDPGFWILASAICVYFRSLRARKSCRGPQFYFSSLDPFSACFCVRAFLRVCAVVSTQKWGPGTRGPGTRDPGIWEASILLAF